jgi:hypothetical protein
MADDILSENITISGVEDTGIQIKIRDQNKKTYSFFKMKKDGNETEAYRSYQQFKIGDAALITYKEVPYKDGSIKNIMQFKPATGQPQQSSSPPASNFNRQPRQDKPGREYWEKRELNRQSSILFQVAFKAAIALQVANIRSGQEENHSQIYDSTLEFYDWLEGQLSSGDSKPGGNKKQNSGSQRETNDDDFPF